MPTELASRLRNIAPSETLEVSARARALAATGVDVFAFGVGEPDFEPPKFILDAAKAAIDKGVSKYTAVTGIAPLKQAICERAAAEGVSITPDRVCVGVGVKHVLFNLALALLDDGDEVIIPAPYWVSYPEQVRLMGGKPVIVETREADGFRMSAKALEGAISARTKAVILCTPSNPSGAAYAEADLRPLLDVLRKHDVWLISDEIYRHLVYDGFQHVSALKLAPDLADRNIVCDGVSKTYAMTGWRIGWSLAPAKLSKAIDMLQGQSTTNAAAISQHAALAAITGPQAEVERMRAEFERRRDAMVAGLNQIDGLRCEKPRGAFYAFCDCRGLYGLVHKGKKIETDKEVAMFLLEEAHVAVVHGSAFGAPGYLRISFASSVERIEAAMSSIRAAISRAKG